LNIISSIIGPLGDGLKCNCLFLVHLKGGEPKRVQTKTLYL